MLVCVAAQQGAKEWLDRMVGSGLTGGVVVLGGNVEVEVEVEWETDEEESTASVGSFE
jgi:hypothetical protein